MPGCHTEGGQLQPVEVPHKARGFWRVEQEFVGAIRWVQGLWLSINSPGCALYWLCWGSSRMLLGMVAEQLLASPLGGCGRVLVVCVQSLPLSTLL